jgi:hypothetical protein
MWLVLLPPVILVAALPFSIAGYVGLVPDDGRIVSLLLGASYLVTAVIGGLTSGPTAAG